MELTVPPAIGAPRLSAPGRSILGGPFVSQWRHGEHTDDLRPRALLVPRGASRATTTATGSRRTSTATRSTCSSRRSRSSTRSRRSLEKISPHFRADARPSGGSLFRIYRDTRFSKDKSPYKTNVGIHFRHERAKDAHAPGFYLHIGPDEVFAGGGMWHPDTQAATRIREAIVADPDRWRRATRTRRLREAARARRRLAQARPALGRRRPPVRGRPQAEGLLRLDPARPRTTSSRPASSTSTRGSAGRRAARAVPLRRRSTSSSSVRRRPHRDVRARSRTRARPPARGRGGRAWRGRA